MSAMPRPASTTNRIDARPLGSAKTAPQKPDALPGPTCIAIMPTIAMARATSMPPIRDFDAGRG